MAISGADESQLLLSEDKIEGFVDENGRVARRSTSGRWRSASFIIVVEMAERFAFYGISANLITFLTGPLGQDTATAAENVNVWSGTATLLSLLGAVVADSFLGRYRTIILASAIYILGLGLLTVSAMLPSHNISGCNNANNITSRSPKLQVILFFFSLYLVAIGQSGHKPCVQAFGADQFDGQDPEECKAKSSFFNWWYFCLCASIMATTLILSYIQDNLNWALGFGIPCISMVIALMVFLLGTKTYRFSVKRNNKSPFMRIGGVYIAAIKNRKHSSLIAFDDDACGTMPEENFHQFRFLNKALLKLDGSDEYGNAYSINEVEEAKSVLRLVPVWVISFVYGVVSAQTSTFFTKQGVTLDRSITRSFTLPPAALQSVISLAIIVVIPIYDRILVPIARSFTHKPGGITMLQRIGVGICLSVICMVVSALVEMKRLETAKEYGIVDSPNVTIPMTVWWLAPQYVLFGIAESFTMVGLQEFFYDQVPSELRSVGLSLYLSIFGVGNFLSSILISVIDKATNRDGKDGWFDNNLNKAHIDYFYWLLAVLSFVELAAYLYFTKAYIYNNKRGM